MRGFRNVMQHGFAWTRAAMLLVSVVTLSVGLSAQSAPLSLVSTAWAPFTNAAGQPRFALDLVEEALKRVGVTSKTTIVSADQFTQLILSGRYDGSAAAWRDPEREKVLIYSEHYLQNRLVLVGRRGAPVSAKTLAELKGKRIVIVGGYSYGDIEKSGPVFVPSASEEDSLTRVLNGSADYTLMDELVVEYLLKTYPQQADARLQIGSTPLVTRELFLALRRSRPDALSIINKFNGTLRTMVADGTYHRLLHVDWIQADVNNDGVPDYVPAQNRVGTAPPTHTYTLFTSTEPSKPTPKPDFYVGGNIYSNWASVPENYKLSNSDRPDPSRSTASIFTFKW